MFDIRLRVFTPDGVRGRVLKTLSIDYTDERSGTPTLRFQTSSRVADYMTTPLVVGIEYTTGAGWVEPRNGRFIVKEDDADAVDPAGITSFTGVGLISWLLGKTYLGWSASAKNGRRVWTNRSPGYIFAGMLTESQTRGWAPYVTYDFTGTTDSTGAAWPAADRTSPEYSYPLALSQILSGLASDGLCEWWTEGLNLRMGISGLGVDRATGEGAVRLGPGASAAPTRSNFDDVFTHLTVIPEKAEFWLYLTNTGADMQFGRLESTMSQSGVKDHTTATRLAQPALSLGRASRRAASLTYDASTATHLPWVHYDTGDLVQARLRGGWENLRIIELVVRKNSEGVVNVSTSLDYRFRSLISRLAGRTGAAAQGKLVGGAGGIPIPAPGGSQMPRPKAPTGLAEVSNEGTFDGAGKPIARVEVSWLAVTQATDGSEIDIAEYELWSSVEGKWKRQTAAQSLSAKMSLEPLRPVTFRVRAISVNRDYSDWSTTLTVTPALPLTVPFRPTAPIATSRGVVTVRWDGMLLDGVDPVAPDLSVAHVYAAMSETEFGTYSPVGMDMGQAGQITLAEIPLNVTRWFKLYTVNRVGIVSPPSDAVSVTTMPFPIGDLDPSVQGAIDAALEAGQSAQATADGKNTIYVATTAPSPALPKVLIAGDQWWKLGTGATAGQIVGVQIHNGSTWSNYAIVADSILVPSSVGGVSIKDGAVNAQKIAAGQVESQHLIVGVRPAQGESQQRISAPLTDSDFWGKVIASEITLESSPGMVGASATDTGIIIYQTGSDSAYLTVMPRTPVPISRQIHVTWIDSQNKGRLHLRWFDAAGGFITDSSPDSGTAGTAPTDAASYTAFIRVAPGLGITRFLVARVFEVVSTGVTGQQSVEISPSAIVLRDDTGSPVVQIGTNTKTFLSVQKNTGIGMEVQASIDSEGTIYAQNASVNSEINVRGSLLLGSFENVYRNGSLDDGPIIDRLSRGMVRTGYFTKSDEVNINTAYRAIAYWDFDIPSLGRLYELGIDSTVSALNSGTGTAYMEVLLSDSPIALTDTTGYHVLRSLSWSSTTPETKGGLMMSRAMFVSSDSPSTLRFKRGTNYILIRIRNTGGSKVNIAANGSVNHGVSIKDIGPNSGGMENFTNIATSGTPPLPPAAATTIVRNMAWSRSWNNNGGSIVSGSGQYDNSKMLYQGYGASNMGAMMGWSALGLTGKTISRVDIFMHNRHTEGGGAITCNLGTSNSGYTAPASHGITNEWSVAWGKGAAAWTVVPSATYPFIANGTIKSIALKVRGGEYGYWDGVGAADRPQIRITYK